MNDFAYYAFISYSSKNTKWAKWLHHSLEYYQVPSVVRKGRSSIPQHIRPVFWYRTDLAGTNLSEALRNELRDSKFLIVICSPQSARSVWVNDEVQAFIEMGREKMIIPLIVEGEPHAADPARECFPPALRFLDREKEVRGIDVRDGKERALVNIVATMFKLRFDALWGRHRRRQKKLRALFGAAAAVLLAVGVFLFAANRSSWRYFTDYTDVWGIPEGIGELSADQARHRGCLYRFQYKRTPIGQPDAWKWRLKEVCRVNSAGVLVEEDPFDPQRAAVRSFVYGRRTGEVAKIYEYDAFRRVRQILHISKYNGVRATIADFASSDENVSQAFVGVAKASLDVKLASDQKGVENIIRYVYERDAQGHIVQMTYHANNDFNLERSATFNNSGLYGERYELDSLGRPLRVSYLGEGGTPSLNREGIAGQEIRYGPSGKIVRIVNLDADGQPCLNLEYWAVYTADYDARGQLIREAYLDAAGVPCLYDGQYHMRESRYDAAGFNVGERYFGTDSLPCLISEGYSRVDRVVNRRGHIVETRLFGPDDQPCADIEGHARWTAKYDKRGNQTAASYFDVDDRPSRGSYGYVRWEGKYDRRHNLVEKRFYDEEGRLTMSNEGCAWWTARYNASGARTEMEYFDTLGNPCLSTWQCARWEQVYDGKGNIVETRFYGVDGEPCLNSELCARWVAEYDDAGNRIAASFYGVDGQPCMNFEDCASWRGKFDDKGNKIECAFFDTQGKPAAGSFGYVRWKAKYDNRGNRIEKSYYNARGALCNSHEDCAFWRARYDFSRRIIEKRYYDAAGNLLRVDRP